MYPLMCRGRRPFNRRLNQVPHRSRRRQNPTSLFKPLRLQCLRFSFLTLLASSKSESMRCLIVHNLMLICHRNILANKDLILNHLDAYFEYLYWMPCLGYIHKSTIYAELEVGSHKQCPLEPFPRLPECRKLVCRLLLLLTPT